MSWEEVKKHLTPSAIKKGEQAKEDKEKRKAGEAVAIPMRNFNVQNIIAFSGMGMEVKVK